MSGSGNEQIVSGIVSEISKQFDNNYVYNLTDPVCSQSKQFNWPIHSSSP